MRLSIIVTVFNKEAYIERCLNSCIRQESVGPDSYEILVIDDGSTDCSKTLIERYLVDNENIRLVSQKNSGLSIARNNGINEARGDYVWFVDADDYISENSVARIIEASLCFPDVIPIQSATEGVAKIRNVIPISANDGRSVLLSSKWVFCGPFYIYKKSFLIENNLLYYPGIYHEDSDLTPRVLFYAQSVSVIPEVLYTVTRDPNSITQVPRVKRAYDYVFIASRLYRFNKDIVKDDSPVSDVFDHIISVIVNNALNIISGFDSLQKKEFDRTLYDGRQVLDSLRRGGHFKYRLEYVLFLLFPRRYCKIYELLRRFA